MDPLEAERLIFGYDHAERGAGLAEAWGLAEELTRAIGAHHAGGDEPLAQAVFEARLIARGLGIGDGLSPPPQPEPTELASAPQVLAQAGGPERLAKRVDWYRAAPRG